MAVLEVGTSKGRDFTASELVGRQIRIEGPVPKKNPPIGYQMYILADDEAVNNAFKLELIIDPCSVVEAKITLYRFDLHKEPYGDVPTEVVTLRDNVEVSFSAIVSEVQ